VAGYLNQSFAAADQPLERRMAKQATTARGELVESNMTLTTRRQLVQQTAFAAASLCGSPIKALAGARRIFEPLEQNAAPLDPAAIQKLASQMSGPVITPEAPDYESARMVFDRAFTGRPALIVRCAGAPDVARALEFAENQTLPLAVRGGGHNRLGFSVCDGGVVIDLSAMNRVEVDANKRVARAEAGSLERDLDPGAISLDFQSDSAQSCEARVLRSARAAPANYTNRGVKDMSEYEIGRDLQALRSRVELLESGGQGRRQTAGTSEGHRAAAGLDAQKKPIVWKQTKGVLPPPFMHNLLRLPHGIQADSAESQTWGCVPEPLILYVNWAGGATDEYCRFVNQSFSLMRFTNPNNGVTTAQYNYSAQLIASGKAHNTWDASPLSFSVQLRDGGGGVVLYGGLGSNFWVSCNDNLIYGWGAEFNPGLYDLIKGATWQITGWQSVDHC
jgi:hypothetical protein